MTTEPQPELRWAPIPPKPRNRGRAWLIAGLVVLTLIIAGALLLFLIPRDDEADPGASSSPTPTSSSSPTASPSPTPTSTPTPTATPTVTVTPTPTTTPPPVADPSLEAFRAQVGGWLDDARTGLDIVSTSTGPDAAPVVDSLQEDAQRLSDAAAPASIDVQWRDGVAAYSQRLQELRAAIDAGGDWSAAVSSALGSVDELDALIGR